MKLYLPLLVVCIGACPAYASPQQRTMVVTTASSEVKKIEVSTQTRITFSKNLTEMIVADDNSQQQQVLNVNDIANIIFTIDSSDGLADRNLDDLLISHSGGIVTISGAETIDYSVWDMSVAQVACGRGNQTVSIDFNALSAGVYIIKANNKTIKFINH